MELSHSDLLLWEARSWPAVPATAAPHLWQSHSLQSCCQLITEQTRILTLNISCEKPNCSGRWIWLRHSPLPWTKFPQNSTVMWEFSYSYSFLLILLHRADVHCALKFIQLPLCSPQSFSLISLYMSHSIWLSTSWGNRTDAFCVGIYIRAYILAAKL